MKLFEYQVLSKTVGNEVFDSCVGDWKTHTDLRFQVGIFEAARAIAETHFQNCSAVTMAVRPRGQNCPRIVTCKASHKSFDLFDAPIKLRADVPYVGGREL